MADNDPGVAILALCTNSELYLSRTRSFHSKLDNGPETELIVLGDILEDDIRAVREFIDQLTQARDVHEAGSIE